MVSREVKVLTDRVITLVEVQNNFPKDSEHYQSLELSIYGLLDKILDIPDGYRQYILYLTQI